MTKLERSLNTLEMSRTDIDTLMLTGPFILTNSETNANTNTKDTTMGMDTGLEMNTDTRMSMEMNAAIDAYTYRRSRNRT